MEFGQKKESRKIQKQVRFYNDEWEKVDNRLKNLSIDFSEYIRNLIKNDLEESKMDVKTIVQKEVNAYRLMNVVSDIRDIENIKNIINKNSMMDNVSYEDFEESHEKIFELIDQLLLKELEKQGFKYDSDKNGYINKDEKYYFDKETCTWYAKYYCTHKELKTCEECSLSNYGLDCENYKI